MNGDPTYPISLELATRSVCSRLATNAGVDVRKLFLGNNDLNPGLNETEANRDNQLEQIEALWKRADFVLHVSILIHEIGVWLLVHGEWKRIVPATYLEMYTPGFYDEFSGFYVDREELVTTIQGWQPEEFEGFTASSIPPRSGTELTLEPVRGKVGRPKGAGYALKDVPVFQTILEAQRQSGNVHSHHSLITKYSHQTTGTSPQSIVDRLRKTLPNWLDENGHEWKPSN